eukprot:scaffold3236_cov66-Cylindrotheca_fusiformis.AAC.5
MKLLGNLPTTFTYFLFTTMTTTTTTTTTYLFIDCDDTIYRDDWTVAKALTKQINSYATDVLNLPDGQAYELYKKHGTCLRGLQQEKYDFDVEDFLHTVHSGLPIQENIQPNERLKRMLRRIDDANVKSCIFTASIREHVIRCLTAADVYESYFEDKPIIDVRSVNFHTKHDPEALEFAKDIMKATDPTSCILVDDSQTNIRVAKLAGWKTVLIGYHSRDGKSQKDFEYADFVIDELSDLDTVLPELFHPETTEESK